MALRRPIGIRDGIPQLPDAIGVCRKFRKVLHQLHEASQLEDQVQAVKGVAGNAAPKFRRRHVVVLAGKDGHRQNPKVKHPAYDFNDKISTHLCTEIAKKVGCALDDALAN